MNSIIKTGVVAIFLSTSTVTAGTLEFINGDANTSGASLDVFESLDDGLGTYDVTNNTGGALLGFGVSNNDSQAGLINSSGTLSEIGAAFEETGNHGFNYLAMTLTESDWTEELVPIFDLGYGYNDFILDVPENVPQTFSNIFGDFSTVAGGDNTINWYSAFDNALMDGYTVSNFFGFEASNVASSIIGITNTNNGLLAFTAGQANTGTNPVPLPATGWLIITGLGGLFALGRKRRASRVASI